MVVDGPLIPLGIPVPDAAAGKLSTEDSLIDAIDVVVAPMSCIGSSSCMTSGDSMGLLKGVWPNAEFTRRL